MASTTTQQVPAYCEEQSDHQARLLATDGPQHILEARIRAGKAHFNPNSNTPLEDLGYDSVPTGVHPMFKIGDSVILSYDTCALNKVEQIGWCPVAQQITYILVIGTPQYRRQYNLHNDKHLAYELDLRNPVFQTGSRIAWVDEQNGILHSRVKVIGRHIHYRSQHLLENVPSDHFQYFYTLRLANGRRVACTESKLVMAREILREHLETLVEPTYAMSLF